MTRGTSRHSYVAWDRHSLPHLQHSFTALSSLHSVCLGRALGLRHLVGLVKILRMQLGRTVFPR